MNIFNDYLGFTDQTATVLRGLEANNLINECKKRDISTSELHRLNEEDFIVLGATDQLAKRLADQLRIFKKIKNTDTSLETRLKTNLEILNHNEKQLNYIRACLTYYRLKCTKETMNIIVDANKAISASDTLIIAANEALHQMQDIEEALQNLKSLMPKETVTHKQQYILACTMIIGMGALCIILYKYKG